MTIRGWSKWVLPALLAAAIPLEAWARIKLVTLPVRERVEIRLDHADATLVEEERVVPLTAGVNQVDFSWANSRVDPGSVLFRLLPAPGGEEVGAEVLAVSYPPNENALVWSVAAQRSGPARVRIGYLLGGLEKAYHYRAVADHDERLLSLFHYLKIQNYASEEYADAFVQAGFGEPIQRPLGLDESKELLLARYDGVPVTKRYSADLSRHGYADAAKKKLRIPMHYVLQNDAAHGLGHSALPFGKARIFQQDGKGGSSFVGEDWAQFTPRDDELALFLGEARDISVVRTLERNDRQRVGGDLYHYDLVVKYEIENFKDSAVTLDIAEVVKGLRAEIGRDNGRDVQWTLGPETTLSGPPDPEHSDADRLVFHAPLPPRQPDGTAQKLVHKLHLQIKNEW
jgi:hypothetical protein